MTAITNHRIISLGRDFVLLIGFSLVSLLLNGCGTRSAADRATLAAVGEHYDAMHCEIFVDKIAAARGSHASRELKLFVKVLPERLDGSVEEVGFHDLQQGSSTYGSPLGHDWKDEPMPSVFGATDYFSFYMPISSDFGRMRYEGVFYVRSLTGTTYWLKPDAGKNFVFDSDTYYRIEDARGGPDYSTDVGRATPTQQNRGLAFLNPDHCY